MPRTLGDRGTPREREEPEPENSGRQWTVEDTRYLLQHRNAFDTNPLDRRENLQHNAIGGYLGRTAQSCRLKFFQSRKNATAMNMELMEWFAKGMPKHRGNSTTAPTARSSSTAAAETSSPISPRTLDPYAPGPSDWAERQRENSNAVADESAVYSSPISPAAQRTSGSSQLHSLLNSATHTPPAPHPFNGAYDEPWTWGAGPHMRLAYPLPPAAPPLRRPQESYSYSAPSSGAGPLPAPAHVPQPHGHRSLPVQALRPLDPSRWTHPSIHPQSPPVVDTPRRDPEPTFLAPPIRPYDQRLPPVSDAPRRDPRHTRPRRPLPAPYRSASPPAPGSGGRLGFVDEDEWREHREALLRRPYPGEYHLRAVPIPAWAGSATEMPADDEMEAAAAPAVRPRPSPRARASRHLPLPRPTPRLVRQRSPLPPLRDLADVAKYLEPSDAVREALREPLRNSTDMSVFRSRYRVLDNEFRRDSSLAPQVAGDAMDTDKDEVEGPVEQADGEDAMDRS